MNKLIVWLIFIMIFLGQRGLVSADSSSNRSPDATPQLFDSSREPSHLTNFGERLFVASPTDCGDGEFPPDCRIYRRHQDAFGGLDIHINAVGTTNNIYSTNIASDADYTYFQGNFGTISRVSNHYFDADPTTYFAVKENAASVGEVAVDDDYVYWTENIGDSGKLFRAAKSTGTRELMAEFPDDPAVNLKIDDQGRAYIRTDIFAFLCCNDIIAQVAPNGGGFAVTYSGIVEVHDFVVSDSTIYAAHRDLSNDNVVVKSAALTNFDEPADWTTRTTIAPGPTIKEMTLSDSALFWHQATSNSGPIKRMPLATDVTVSLTTSINVKDIVLIEDHLYFIYLGAVYKLPIDAELIANDLVANEVMVEGVQVMQNATHTVPLIEGKRTFVRAYGRIGSSSQGLTSLNLSPGMVLYGTRGATELEGSPLRPIRNPAFAADAVDRTTLDNTWLFELPPSWTEGTIELTAVANDARLFDETSYSNNSSLPRTLTFEPVRGLCLDMLAVSTTDGTSITSGSGLRQHVQRAYTMLPVNQFGTVWRGGPARTRPVTNVPYDMHDAGEKISLMFDLMFEFMFSGPPPHCGDWHVVRSIMVPDSDRFGMSHPVAPFIYFLERYNGSGANTVRGGVAGLAHELGHQLQGGHVNCPISGTGSPGFPYVTLPYPTQCHIDYTNNHIGYDPLSDSLIVPLDGSNQPLFNDLMAYGGPNYPSEFVYLRLLDSLALSRRRAAPAVVQVGEKQVAGGYIEADGTAHLDPIYEVDSTTATQMQAVIDAGDMSSSDYKLTISHGGGTIDIPLLVQEDFGDGDGGLVFLALFDPLAAISKVELIDGAKKELLEVVADTLSPNITITEPLPGATISDENMTIGWKDNTFSGDPGYFRVLYSGDGGSSWYEVANTTGPIVTVATATLPGGSNGVVRVYASDGLNSDVAEVTGLTLPNSAPLVTISPRLTGNMLGGSDATGLITFPAGSDVRFDGVAFDLEDGPIDGADLSWSLGVGASSGETYTTRNLKPGFYTVTLSAEDGQGASGFDQVQFRVLPKQVNDGVGVVLDGHCEDAGYAADVDPLPMAGLDDDAEMRMVRAGGSYYICISNMQQQPYADEYVELRFDLDNSKDSIMQSSDRYVRLYRDGRFEQGVGTGSSSGDSTTSSPPSPLFAGDVTMDDDNTTWQAEIRIDDSLFPTWNSYIGLQVRHRYSVSLFGFAVWPGTFPFNNPANWGETALGIPAVPTAVTVQVGAADSSVVLVVLPVVMLLVVATVVGVRRRYLTAPR